VETSTPLETGQEFELRLVGGETHRPIRIRGIVESRQAQGTPGVEYRSGVRFRLLRFAREYSMLISGETPTQEEIQATARQTARAAAGEEERQWFLDVLEADGARRGDKQNDEAEPEAWEEYEPLSERAGVPLWSDDTMAPEALVIDDGELDDVVEILAELGVKTERQSPPGDTLPANWIRPQRLLVVTARRALKLRLSLGTESQTFLAISVAANEARMVCSAVRRLGYHYAVSRPIHPLAMSMLFRQTIFPDNESRVIPREVLGCSVDWWCSWGRKRPGVILDISQVGCQLLAHEAVPLGSVVKIRVPEGLARGRAMTLNGEVMWSSLEAGGTRLGVAFGELSDRTAERLQDVLALPGPCSLKGDPLLLDEEAIASERLRTKSEKAFVERRLKIRAAMNQEVVALEHQTSRIMHVLISSDLTVDGMRVEAHPSLSIGDQMDLALYENSEGDPLMLSALVARDDGRLGWWLRFVGVTPEAHTRILEALDRFPPVTRLDKPDPESGRVVIGQMIKRAKSSPPEEG
jgi:hypothetical protein